MLLVLGEGLGLENDVGAGAGAMEATTVAEDENVEEDAVEARETLSEARLDKVSTLDRDEDDEEAVVCEN